MYVYAVVLESTLVPHPIQVTVAAVDVSGAIAAAHTVLDDSRGKVDGKQVLNPNQSSDTQLAVHEVTCVCPLGAELVIDE